MFAPVAKNIYLCLKLLNYELEKDINPPGCAHNC